MLLMGDALTYHIYGALSRERRNWNKGKCLG